MRLSPLLVTVVAVAAPLSRSLSANAQTPNNSQQAKQTASVLLPTVAQDLKVVGLPTTAAVAQPEVIIPTSTPKTELPNVIIPTSTPKTVQNPPINSAPDIPPPSSLPYPNQSPTQQNPQAPFPSQTTPPIIQQNTQPPPTQQNSSPPIIQQNTQPPPTQQNPQAPSTQENSQPNPAPTANETRVLVSEVLIKPQAGQLSPELENQVYRVIRTQAGRTTTRSQLQEDINAIFATGFFSNVQAVPEDTPLGVRVSFIVQPNPTLTKVQLQVNSGPNSSSVIPPNAVDEIFRPQYGKILNLRDLQEGIKQLTKRYQDQGYVLANVVGAPQVSDNGVVTLQVAEGLVENIRVRFRNKEGQETDEKGKPIRGRTQPYIVTRELQLKPGQIFNRNTIQKDLQRVYGLGLFQDVNVSLDPGTDPTKVDVVVNVVEKNSGSIGAGAGLSSASGLFGQVSYQEQNLNGRNQKLGAEVQVGQRDILFDLRYTDPWIGGDSHRTSYTADIFSRRSVSLIFDGPKFNIETFDPKNPTAQGDTPRISRLGTGITFTRPLSKDPLQTNSEWVASAGFQYQRVTITDSNGNLRKLGQVNNNQNDLINLSASGEGRDDLLLLQVGAARDRRNNPLQPTSGSVLRFGLDQSVPLGLGNILLTRVRGSYSQYIPVNLTHFKKGPQALAFNVQAGTVLGDLPPYEAFSLGGSNSVRGYDEGQLAASRSFVQASLEYRFPVFSVISGALFFDVGSDLGTSTNVSQVLNKNGTGYGYGIGVRVQSPLGPIRIDYGINDDGGSRINFGIGERF